MQDFSQSLNKISEKRVSCWQYAVKCNLSYYDDNDNTNN